MTTQTSGDETLAAAIGAAIAPYPWRRFTPELVARLTLAAHDRHHLQQALAAVPGATVGAWERLEPVAREDTRAAAVVHVLKAHPWAGLSLPTLCRRLSDALRA